MAAVYGGRIAAGAIDKLQKNDTFPDFSPYITGQKENVSKMLDSTSRFSAIYVRNEIAKLMNDCLGITRTEEKLIEGISGDYNNMVGLPAAHLVREIQKFLIEG